MNTHKAFRGIACLAFALGIAGCAATNERSLLTPEQYAELSVPLDIREFRSTSGGGVQAVFIKLSRLPNGVDHHVDTSAAAVVLDLQGPAGAANVDEEALQADDPLLRIRVARSPTMLRLSLDMRRGVVPPYSVHVLADWVMVRFETEAGVDG